MKEGKTVSAIFVNESHTLALRGAFFFYFGIVKQVRGIICTHERERKKEEKKKRMTCKKEARKHTKFRESLTDLQLSQFLSEITAEEKNDFGRIHTMKTISRIMNMSSTENAQFQ